MNGPSANEYYDADLKDWQERIWAANEYRYGDLSTIKAFVEWAQSQ